MNHEILEIVDTQNIYGLGMSFVGALATTETWNWEQTSDIPTFWACSVLSFTTNQSLFDDFINNSSGSHL